MVTVHAADMRDCTTTCLCEGIYMLGEVPAPHSPSGGAAVLHPIGAQLIPTVQENAKDRYINKDTSGAYAAGWPRPPPCARARRAGPPQRGHHGVACTREDPARKPGASPAVGKRGRPPKRGLERAGAKVSGANVWRTPGCADGSAEENDCKRCSRPLPASCKRPSPKPRRDVNQGWSMVLNNPVPTYAPRGWSTQRCRTRGLRCSPARLRA